MASRVSERALSMPPESNHCRSIIAACCPWAPGTTAAGECTQSCHQTPPTTMYLIPGSINLHSGEPCRPCRPGCNRCVQHLFLGALQLRHMADKSTNQAHQALVSCHGGARQLTACCMHTWGGGGGPAQARQPAQGHTTAVCDQGWQQDAAAGSLLHQHPLTASYLRIRALLESIHSQLNHTSTASACSRVAHTYTCCCLHTVSTDEQTPLGQQ